MLRRSKFVVGLGIHIEHTNNLWAECTNLNVTPGGTVHQVTGRLERLTSELYGGEWSDSRLGCLTPEVRAPQYPLGYGAGRASDLDGTFWRTSSRNVPRACQGIHDQGIYGIHFCSGYCEVYLFIFFYASHPVVFSDIYYRLNTQHVMSTVRLKNSVFNF
jgi:hypothetical protein